MKPRRRKFNSKRSAQRFAKKVGGKIIDLRNDDNAKSNFSVYYQPNEKTRKHYRGGEVDWRPEEDRDFGYPNSFWKD